MGRLEQGRLFFVDFVNTLFYQQKCNTLRSMAISLFLATLILSKPGSIDQTISFRCPGTRAVQMLPQLSKATGVEFSCDQKVRDEVLIVDVKEVKLRELMDHLAEAASAKWVLYGDRYRLERPSELEADLRKKEIGRLAGLLKVQVERERIKVEDRDKNRKYEFADILNAAHKAVSNLISNGDESIKAEYIAQFRDLEQIIANGPPQSSELFLYQLLDGLDLTQIASVQPGNRVVLSTNPSLMQRRLFFPKALLVNYDKARLQATLALNSLPNDEAKQSIQNAKFLPNDSTSPVTKCLLSVQRDSVGSSFAVEFRILSITGSLIDFCKTKLSWLNYEKEPKNKGTSQLVKWSADSAQFLEGLRRSSDELYSFPKELEQKLLKPSQYDPLSLVVSDIFFNLAESKSANLVGSLPDAAIFFAEIASQKATISEIESGLRTQDHVVTELKDSWLTVKPAHPIAESKRRIDRSAYEAFINSCFRKGYFNMNDRLTFARTLPVKPDAILDSLLSCSIMPNLAYEIPGNWDDYRLATQLSPVHWRILETGGNLPIRSLSPKALEIAIEAVYGDGDSIGNDDLNSPLDVEPTEAFPNGLPYSAYLNMVSGESYVAFEKQDTSRFEYIKAKDFARDFASKSPEYSAKRFLLGKEWEGYIGICLSEGQSILVELRDLFKNNAMQPILPSQFPKDFLQEIQKERDELIQYEENQGKD